MEKTGEAVYLPAVLGERALAVNLLADARAAALGMSVELATLADSLWIWLYLDVYCRGTSGAWGGGGKDARPRCERGATSQSLSLRVGSPPAVGNRASMDAPHPSCLLPMTAQAPGRFSRGIPLLKRNSGWASEEKDIRHQQPKWSSCLRVSCWPWKLHAAVVSSGASELFLFF